jgi:transcriptional regulator with XRE-family HTH domain
MDILDVVREEIAASGKAQSEIARDSGVPQPTVNRIANGRTRPSYGTVQKLCRALPRLASRLAEDLQRAS